MDYDFKSLSDYDFEELCCDLLRAELKRPIELFRKGRDGGIDLRTSSGRRYNTRTSRRKSTIIAQCKHYANTPFSGLYRAMTEELPKLNKRQPGRYLLVTSHFFTPGEKDRLFELLHPFCQSTEDIIGGNELNALLRQHPQVEQAHYKLWLTSTAVLEKLLHSDIYQQSEFLQEEIIQKLKLYVQSRAAYEKATKVLNETNCCIISGIPGIGKTTLAEILLIHYLDLGYQIIKVRSDIREAMSAYRQDTRQIFLYDDFLGSTALEMKSNKNEGKELLSFMSHISRQTGKKFILTTREYILNQARQSFEDFARHDFDLNKCIISLADYTRENRARILYNHLYFYHVPRAHIENLLVEDRIMNIVHHTNYSPRLIEIVTNQLRCRDASHFYDHFLDTLDHPNKLWEHAFSRQISPAARDLLILMFAYPYSTHLGSLEKHFEAFHRHKAFSENRALSGTDFKDALREVEGTFIKIDRSFVSYHNPSVKDFIQGYLLEHPEEFRMLCESAVDFDFCVKLAKLDTALCIRAKNALLEALNRTMNISASFRTSVIHTSAAQVKQLAQINSQLHFPEIDAIITAFLQNLPRLLLQEQEDMTGLNWHQKEEPHELRELLTVLSGAGYEMSADSSLYDAILQYALIWFETGSFYTIEDFLLFQDIDSVSPFDKLSHALRPVYEALKDFDLRLAFGCIEEMDYEDDCEDFRTNVLALEKLFSVNLSHTKSDIDDRIWELQTMEEDEEDEEHALLKPPKKALDDSEILDMFHSLLECEEPA